MGPESSVLAIRRLLPLRMKRKRGREIESKTENNKWEREK